MVNDVIFTLKLFVLVSVYFKNVELVFHSLVITPNLDLTLYILSLEIVNILITRLSKYHCSKQ